ncbi:unnamed protein product [marine sediment metagenome]|uniref:Uncharacterized protein n=1 Tax=marine sediment metagenome TaxID=412755 RepID=X1LMZ7_9ZZZZ
MKNIQIDKDVYSLPESWDEVTVNQFLELRNCENADFITILSKLINAPYDKVFFVNSSNDSILNLFFVIIGYI